jgi:hypothetical protein
MRDTCKNDDELFVRRQGPPQGTSDSSSFGLILKFHQLEVSRFHNKPEYLGRQQRATFSSSQNVIRQWQGLVLSVLNHSFRTITLTDHRKEGSDDPLAYQLADLMEDLVIVPPPTKPASVFISDDQAMGSYEFLSRMLSGSGSISWHWYLEAANLGSQPEKPRKIGQGQCGTILLLGCSECVIKVPNSVAKEDELYNDAQVHALVSKAVRSAPVELRSDLYVSSIEALSCLSLRLLVVLLRLSNTSI